MAKNKIIVRYEYTKTAYDTSDSIINEIDVTGWSKEEIKYIAQEILLNFKLENEVYHVIIITPSTSYYWYNADKSEESESIINLPKTPIIQIPVVASKTLIGIFDQNLDKVTNSFWDGLKETLWNTLVYIYKKLAAIGSDIKDWFYNTKIKPNIYKIAMVIVIALACIYIYFRAKWFLIFKIQSSINYN